MATITGLNPHVERPFGPKAWKVEWDLAVDGATGTVDIPIDTLPLGTVIYNCTVLVTTAEAGATSSALDVEVGANNLLDPAADALGAVSRHSGDDGTTVLTDLTTINTALASAAAVLNAEITIVGTATTAAVFYVIVDCGRIEY